NDPRTDRLAVELRPDSALTAQPQPKGAQAGQHLAAPAVVLAAVHERRVDPERDVVQEAATADPADVHTPLFSAERLERAERVVSIEPNVAGEVIPGAEGNADEGQIALDRDRGDARHGAVTAGHAEHVDGGPARELRGVFAVADDPRLDPEPLRLGAKLVCGRPRPPGAGVDQKEACHAPQAIGAGGTGFRAFGPLRRCPFVPIMALCTPRANCTGSKTSSARVGSSAGSTQGSRRSRRTWPSTRPFWPTSRPPSRAKTVSAPRP